MTRALDYFDLAREYDHEPVEAFSHAHCRFFAVSFSTDWRFPASRSREMVNALMGAQQPVTYVEIESSYGHDAILLSIDRYPRAFQLDILCISRTQQSCL